MEDLAAVSSTAGLALFMDAASESAPGSPCSVASDCSSVATADFEGFADLGSALVLDDLVVVAAAAASLPAPGTCRTSPRSVFALDYVPRWGLQSVCGRRPEMEDATIALPRFSTLPLWMVAGDTPVDGLDRASFCLPAHFFGVYDGHGGLQVANYCRERIHSVLAEELTNRRPSIRLRRPPLPTTKRRPADAPLTRVNCQVAAGPASAASALGGSQLAANDLTAMRFSVHMASESENGNCDALAARDPSGVLSPYKFNRRAVQSGDVSLKITVESVMLTLFGHKISIMIKNILWFLGMR